MKIQIILYSLILISIISCDPVPDEPETDCHLLPGYKLNYHSVLAPKVFDVRTSPPTEIRNGTIEYDLFYQLLSLHDDIPVPYPYSEYFIDSIGFPDVNTAEVRIFESNVIYTYDYDRNDCQLDLESANRNLHLELQKSGEEIAESRFAIYDHKSRRVTIDTLSYISDTFPFIEFRLGHFDSYEDIIKQFALDHPGQYDTIAIERIQNRTKE
jgi:hypothetical protein